MRTGFRLAVGVGLAVSAVAWPVRADPSISAILSFNECISCHAGGTAPSIASAAGGLAVIDPSTNLAVTQYVPKQTYTIRMRFVGRLFNGVYRNSYWLALTAGQLIDNGQVGLVQGLRNARVLTTSNATVANTMEVSWVAPQSGTVQLSAFRMETNDSESTAGDYVSQTAETISLSPGSGGPTPPPDGSTPSPFDASPGGPADGASTNAPADMGAGPQQGGVQPGGNPPASPAEPDPSSSPPPPAGCQMGSGGAPAMGVFSVFLLLGLALHRRRSRR